MKLGRKSFSAEEAEEILQRLAIQYRNPNSIGYQCVSKALTHLNDPRFGLDRETQNWLEFAITALGRTGRTQKR